jgi:AraC-like DNA-binding protein
VVILDETGSKTDTAASKTNSYKKSGLSSEAADKFLNRLNEIMKTEKPYRNNRLNLSDLSGMLGISNHNMSEIINKNLETNFYDFINGFRVREVQKLIVEDSEARYSILALGYEAGFSSKSAFYSSFKKVCGKTPAQYRDELKAKKVA